MWHGFLRICQLFFQLVTEADGILICAAGRRLFTRVPRYTSLTHALLHVPCEKIKQEQIIEVDFTFFWSFKLCRIVLYSPWSSPWERREAASANLQVGWPCWNAFDGYFSYVMCQQLWKTFVKTSSANLFENLLQFHSYHMWDCNVWLLDSVEERGIRKPSVTNIVLKWITFDLLM